ncbi:hypothetical protein OG900_11070 [Streptomyces sp. NBC_00433]
MNADDARRIAARSYCWQLPNGEPAPTSATEFDLGYIVMPVLPPPPPQLPGQPPPISQPGTAAIVVDKATESATVVPYRGDEGTADHYRQTYRQPRP